ncbi:MAG: hypothetical protein AAF471_03675 [Myxococcota bacterium]
MHLKEQNKSVSYFLNVNVLAELRRYQSNAKIGARPSRLPKTPENAHRRGEEISPLTGAEKCVIVREEGRGKAMHPWKHNKAATHSRQTARLKQREPSLVDVMRNSPLFGVELNLERDRSPARDIKL